jgi:hypothetical protein
MRNRKCDAECVVDCGGVLDIYSGNLSTRVSVLVVIISLSEDCEGVKLLQ